MPSIALENWQNDRLVKLGLIDANCASLISAFQPVSPLAEQSLQAYVMLLSGHFQGFCRDLYTECVQRCVAEVPPTLKATLQSQFLSELRLDTKNPTHESIRSDFERFGFQLNLDQSGQRTQQMITHLGLLNKWRNHVAHQKASPLPAGVSGPLILADLQIWRSSCDGLAISLDDKMKSILEQILGKSPW